MTFTLTNETTFMDSLPNIWEGNNRLPNGDWVIVAEDQETGTHLYVTDQGQPTPEGHWDWVKYYPNGPLATYETREEGLRAAQALLEIR